MFAINGGWSNWSEWTSCTELCWLFSTTRSRLCDNPVPLHGGDNCTGTDQEFALCGRKLCPVHGGWAHWGSWSTCSASCGSGVQTRERACTLPRPQHGGKNCSGLSSETENCSLPSECQDQSHAEYPYLNKTFELVTDAANDPNNTTAFRSAELEKEDSTSTVTWIVTETRSYETHSNYNETDEDIAIALSSSNATQSTTDLQHIDGDKTVRFGNISELEPQISSSSPELAQTLISLEHGKGQSTANTGDNTLNNDGNANNSSEVEYVSPDGTEITTLTTAQRDPADEPLLQIEPAYTLNNSASSYGGRKDQDGENVLPVILGTVIPVVAIASLISLLVYRFRGPIRAQCWDIITDEEESNSKASCKNLKVSKDVQENPYQEIDITGHSSKQSLPDGVEQQCVDA